MACHPRALGFLKTHIVGPAFPTVRALFMLCSPECVEGFFSEVGPGNGQTLRGFFATPSPVAASAGSSAALGATPGGRVVLGAIVERPVALRASFEAGPGPALLRSEHDGDQPADGILQPTLIGREQL
jgi:hypothetical protein